MKAQTLNAAKSTPPLQNVTLQRKCDCGNHTVAGGECGDCAGKKRTLRRQVASQQRVPAVPPIVQEVLRSSGQSLEAGTRMSMESSFNRDFSQVRFSPGARQPMLGGLAIGRADDMHEQEADRLAEQVEREPVFEGIAPAGEQISHDFGRVRIHTGSTAAESARAIGAKAYTLGHDIVFGAGEYAPQTSVGRRLLAHELTHVVQQSTAGEGAAAMVQRAISPELDEIESLLSYGIFDWAITDAEAIKALQILKALPKYQQAVFISNEKYLDRLRDNLPDGSIAELDEIVAGVRDVTPPSAEIEDIRSKLSYGIFDWVVTDKEAVEALEKLKQLTGTQLAVALGSINYGRLLDNLPDSRKQELNDLMARNLGVGGAREKEEKAHPGSEINSILFTSDHAIMKDNSEDWENTGSVVQPEWSTDAAGDVISKPISQSKDTSLGVSVNLNVLPVGAEAAPVSLRGESEEPALNFNFNGSMQGGLQQTVPITSAGKLPNGVTVLRNRQVRWRMKWRDWEHEIGRTAHTIYVTMAMPGSPDEVTIKRMAKSIEIVEPLATMIPHDIVRGIMKNWNRYNLEVIYGPNIWPFADNVKEGAQCIDIVRFVQAVIQIIGCPGNAEAVVIWAHPAAPTSAIESPWRMGSMSSIPNRIVGGRLQHCTLLDGDYHSNNFEAALKFDHSGTLAYYPGGVNAVLSSPDQVLRVFRCMAWVELAGGLKCKISEVPANYPDNYGGNTCAPGMVETCYVR